jgi:hypothetical protein
MIAAAEGRLWGIALSCDLRIRVAEAAVSGGLSRKATVKGWRDFLSLA